MIRQFISFSNFIIAEPEPKHTQQFKALTLLKSIVLYLYRVLLQLLYRSIGEYGYAVGSLCICGLRY